MQKFQINGKVTVSCWTVVEAETPEQALEIAKRRELCGFHIDGTYEDTDSFIFDNDGTPFELTIED